MIQQALDICLPAPDPNWWALISIGCGIFILGMAVGALLGAAIAYETSRMRIIHPEEDHIG